MVAEAGTLTFGEERMSERDESDRARLSKIDPKIGNRVQCVRAW